MLLDVYGPEAVLEPHVMPVSLLDIKDSAGSLALLETS